MQVNPKGQEKGKSRVIRGGSWHSNARYCRATHRGSDLSSIEIIKLGFRVVLSSVVKK